MKNFQTKLIVGLLSTAFMTAQVNAGGVPVIDVAGLAQAVTQVTNQISQIRQLQTQVSQMTDLGDYAALFDNSLVRSQLNQYLPSGYTDVMQAVTRGDIGALSQVANAAAAREAQAQTTQSGVERQAATRLLQTATVDANMKTLSNMNREMQSLINQIDTAVTPAQKQDLANALNAKQSVVQIQLAQMDMQIKQLEQQEKLANRQAATEFNRVANR